MRDLRFRRKCILFIFITAFFICTSFLLSTKVYANEESLYDVEQTEISSSSATVTWKASEEAVKFEVICEFDNRYKLLKTHSFTTQKSFILEGLEGTDTIEVSIFAYNKKGKNIGFDRLTVHTFPDKMPELKQNIWSYKQKRLYLDLPDYSYQYRMTDMNGKLIDKGDVRYKDLDKKYYYVPLKNLKKPQAFKLKVRAYFNYKGESYYTDWSEVTCLGQANVNKIVNSNNKLSIEWQKVDGASGYDVYVSNFYYNRFHKVKSVGKNVTKCSINRFNNRKISSSRDYFIYVVTKRKNSSGIQYSPTYYSSYLEKNKVKISYFRGTVL